MIHIGLVRGCRQCLAGLSEAEHEEEFYTDPPHSCLGPYETPEYFAPNPTAYTLSSFMDMRWSDDRMGRTLQWVSRQKYLVDDLLDGENPNIIRSEN